MHTSKRFWLFFAAINGLIALVMGAIGAHVIAEKSLQDLAEKASLYELIHAALLFAIADRVGRFYEIGRWFFLLGLLLFCGSLYLKALTSWTNATAVAPLGGISLMVAWILLALASLRK